MSGGDEAVQLLRQIFFSSTFALFSFKVWSLLRFLTMILKLFTITGKPKTKNTTEASVSEMRAGGCHRE